MRKDAALEPAETRLQIGGGNQRYPRDTLHRIDLRRDLDRCAEGHADAADVILLDPAVHFGEARIAIARVVAEHPHHHHLADTFA